MRSLLLALCLLLVASTPLYAHIYQKGALTVVHPWARATNGSAPNGAAYLTLTIEDGVIDRLVEVQSPVAERAEMYTRAIGQGTMLMPRVHQVQISAEQPAVFEPGGLHILLSGLRAPLKKGDRFPMTLIFERAGRIEVHVHIEDAFTFKPPPGEGHR